VFSADVPDCAAQIWLFGWILGLSRGAAGKTVSRSVRMPNEPRPLDEQFSPLRDSRECVARYILPFGPN
jgi:hypothetical protein